MWAPTERMRVMSLHGWQCLERCRLNPGFCVICFLKIFFLFILKSTKKVIFTSYDQAAVTIKKSPHLCFVVLAHGEGSCWRPAPSWLAAPARPLVLWHVCG